ncbi:MAG: ATPase, T2SS/T4P/T4SS family [Candidatus Dormibacteria bacterium]
MALDEEEVLETVPMGKVATSSRLQIRPWPAIPEDWAGFVDYVADELTATYLGGEHVHDLHEERRLMAPADRQNPGKSGYAVRAMAEALRNPPDEFQLVASELLGDPGKKAMASYWVAVRASRLWPMSLLLYLNGIEDVKYFGEGLWTVEAKGRMIEFDPRTAPVGVRAEDESDLLEMFMAVLAWTQTSGGRALDYSQPEVSANVGELMRLTVWRDPVLSTGGQVQAAIAVYGRSNIWTLEDLVAEGTFSEGIATLLRVCIENKVSMILSGAMATGKTTLMRILSSHIPDWETLTLIEDGAELHLNLPRPDGRPWVRHLQALTSVEGSIRGDGTEIDFSQLVKRALRMRGNRIWLGESRGKEMMDVFNAMTSGHQGALVTIHAMEADEAIERARDYVLQNPDVNMEWADNLVHKAVELVIQLGWTPSGGRAITGIVAPQEKNGHSFIYRWNNEAKCLARVANFGDIPVRLQAKLRGALHGELPE